jgi:hypothetical protein
VRSRSISDHPTTVPSRPHALLLGILFTVAIALYLWTQRHHPYNSWAEDLPVYTQAVSNWLAGHDPYNASLAPLYFLYPPSFLLIAGWFSHLVPQHWGAPLYVLLNLATLFALPLVLARYFFRQPWLSPAFALLLFFASPRFTGVEALRTMNIASPLYGLAFLAAIPGLRSNRWRWFYLAVFLAAIIKITFLALLLLPLLAGKRQWMGSILCGAAVILVNLAQMARWPSLYHGYLWSLNQGILGHQAFGYGVFGLLAHHKYYERGGTGLAPYVVSGVIALLLLALMLRMRLKLERTVRPGQDLATNHAWLAMIVVTVILVNPRQMQYDMDIAVFAAFVLSVIALKVHRLRTLVILMVLIFLPSQIVPLLVSNPRLQGIYETFLCFAAYALGYWRLSRDTSEGTQEAIPRLAPA